MPTGDQQQYMWQTLQPDQMVGWWMALAVPVVFMILFVVVRLGWERLNE